MRTRSNTVRAKKAAAAAKKKAKFTVPIRASVRVAVKGLRTHATEQGIKGIKKKRMEKQLKKGNVWKAVRETYNQNTEARGAVSAVFRPKHRYNPSKNDIINNKRNVNKAITKSIINKNIYDILIPMVGLKRGGVDPSYVKNHALKNANMKYAIVNKNTRNLRALGLIKNHYPEQNVRYIDVIAGYTSYGHPMIEKIIENARRNGRKRVNLSAVIQGNNPNQDPLVQWYKGKGFVRSGNLTSNSLLPMSLVL